MLRRFIGAMIALGAIGLLNAAEAQDNWILLGSKTVNPANVTETIDVSQARGSYKALRLLSRQGGLDISNIEVVYADGTPHSERRNITFNQGDRTRPIDPRSASRFVDRVVLSYRGRGQPALIEVYGLQSVDGARATRSAAVAAPATPSTPAPQPAQPIATTPTRATPATIQPGQVTDDGEVLFGTQTVGFGVDRDVIRVGAEVGKFDRIRMRVLDNDIFIRSMKVVYANGESDEIAYNADIRKDSRTRWLDLKGDRFIREIQLIYNSRPNIKGRAYVEVYGHLVEGWLGPQGEGRKFNQGFVLLGAQTAGFTIDRNDVIRVPRNDGGFRKIRIDVKDEAITLFELRVVYGNGDVDILPANRQRVDAGGSFGPLDLKGGARVITELRPTYRTRIFQQGGVARGRAQVLFWGQH
jgi:hypothetical protein